MIRLEIESELDFPGFRLAASARLPLDGIMGLFGPSGHGKSTLLRVVAGLERGSRGRIALGGEVWQDDAQGRFVEPHRRGVGYVFQDVRLFPHLSVRANLRFAERRAPAAGPGLAFDHIAEMLDLGPLLPRRPSTLSGGERQRVALGRALLTRPRLLLLDEPLSALDLRRKAEIIPYIERLRDELAVPIVYVTHSLDELSRLVRNVALMSEGRIVAVGPLQETMARLDLQPMTGRFEAGSVLEARVQGHDRRYALTLLEVAGQALRMPEIDAAPGATVRVRVRARDVAIALTRPEGVSIRNVMAGRIAAVEVEPGPFAEVAIDLGGPWLRARITRESVDELALAPGRSVFALVKSVALDRRLLAPSARPVADRAPAATVAVEAMDHR
jgi:molybdate transport system ATP-binding protein